MALKPIFLDETAKELVAAIQSLGNGGGSADLSGVNAEINALKTRVATAETNIDALEDTTASNVTNINALLSDTAGLKTRLTAVENKGDGITDTAKHLLVGLLEAAAYGNDAMADALASLKTEWNLDSGGDTPTVVPVTSVALDRNTLELVKGGSATLTATVKPSNATNKTVTWSVSPAGYATVRNGNVTATAAGSCTVTATCGGKSASCAVTVTAAEAVEPNTNPFPSLTPAYMLPQKTVFSMANQECIDTGVKLFETVDPKPNFTILFEAIGGDALKGSADTFVAFHCMEESSPWPGMTMQVLPNADMQLCVYGTKSTFSNLTQWKSGKHRMAIRVQNGELTGWRTDGYAAAWGAIKSMTVVVDKTLILGAMQDSSGTKGRFWDGTFYQFVVYTSALTDDQINGCISGS